MVELPPRLRPRDRVAVTAPAGPVDRARLKRSLPLLEARYTVEIAGDLYARDGYLAGSDERRAGELNAALRDPDIRAVIFARGGYGSTRILDALDAAALRADPIPLVGFSDVTAILGWAYQVAGVAPIHGPVAAQLVELSPADRQRLFSMLESPYPAPGLTGLRPCGAGATGPIEGQLWGGNLSMVSHLVGTPAWPAAGEGAIFFFEDVGERPYAVDRYLTALRARGALESVAAAVAGDLARCGETANPDHPEVGAVIAERLEAFGIPGATGAGFGHDRRNAALPFGGRVRLDPGAGILEFLTGAVT